MTLLKTICLTTALAISLFAGVAADASPGSGNGMDRCEVSAFNQNTANSALYPDTMGGKNKVTNQKAEVQNKLGEELAQDGTPLLSDCNPSAAMKVNMEVGPQEQARRDFPWRGKAATERLTAAAGLVNQQIVDKEFVGKMTEPGRWVKPAQAAAQAQATNAGNAAGEVSRDQASSAIDFCAHYLHNFTVDGGNKWNVIRNNIFVPMAILLLLPGALLTQVRAIMAAGNPVLGNVNPLEGIMRSVIAIFLIPGTYLVVNYSIDLSNSITFTINSEYFRLFGSDMYKDAICAEIRAFPVRGEQENRNALDLPVPAMTPLVNPGGLFAQFEGMMENKIEDPCSGIYQAPGARADEAMSSSSIAARLGLNSSNAALTASWNILCAFQMAYLYYLWFVGPIAAGLWVWPMKQLRGALPSWVEGVITLAFWSLFWNTAILLIACFKGVGETGCVLMTALHFLATASVKHAFDFAGLVRAAGQEAANMAEKAMKSGGAGGGGGGGGGCGGGAKSAGGGQSQGAPSTADGIGALASNSAGSPGGVSVASTSPVAGAGGDSKPFGSTSPVDKAGLSEALALRSSSKGEGFGVPTGTPFDKTSDRTSDKTDKVESAMLPPSEKKEVGDLFNQESMFAPMFLCSAQLADNPAGTLGDVPLDVDYALDASTDSSTFVADTNLTNATAGDTLKSTADGAGSADSSGLPPSAAAVALAEQAKKDEMKELAAAQLGDKAKEAEAHRGELEAKRAEKLAEHINNHLSNLGASVAAVGHIGAGIAGAGSSVANAMGVGAVGGVLTGAAGGAAETTMSMLRDGLPNFDISNALTDVNVDASSSLAGATNISNGWVSSDSLTYGDFAKLEMSDIDVLGSVDTIDASVDNSLSAVANYDSSLVSNPTFAAAAAGNVTQYGDVTAYSGAGSSGTIPSGIVDRSALVGANAYTANAYTANAYTANDSINAPIVSNVSAVPAMIGNQVDASSVVSNAVYSAQAISGNPVVAAVENYNTIPTGAHASIGAQPGSSEYYAAPAASASYVASAQSTSSYADYSTQSASVSSSSYSVDYSQSTPTQVGSQQQGTPVFASVLPSSTPADYTAPAQSMNGTQSGGNVEYYSAQPTPSNTQYAPVQGQPSSFIQPSVPANEYYAAPSQTAPLIAALITPNQSAPMEMSPMQSQQQSYSNPVQYYLANANAQPETRSVENIAPVERPAQQPSDVVYSRSNSEAYTTETPYRHVENTESRPVSFAPAPSQNVQHGPQAVAQYEAVLSQGLVHNKVQQAQGLLTRMNTILGASETPHVVSGGSGKTVDAQPVAQPNAQPVAQPAAQTVTKKSLADLLPVQRKAKAPPKEEMIVTPPPMSNSWFDA